MTAQQAAYTFLPWVQGGIARSIAAADEPGARTDRPGDAARRRARRRRRRRAGVGPAVRARRRHRAPPRPDHAHRPAAGHDRFEAGLHAAGPVRARGPAVAVHARRRRARRRRGCGRGWCSSWCAAARACGSSPTRRPAARARARRPAGDELPDLSQSWAWAHAQIAGLGAGARPADVLARTPAGRARACSARAGCEPDTAYLACLVPAFRAGVKAGLGEPVTAGDEASLEPAWGADSGGAAAPAGLPLMGVRHRPRRELRDAGAPPASQPARSSVGAAAEARHRRAGRRPAGRLGVDRDAERAARARPGRAAAMAGRDARAVPDGARADADRRAAGRPRAAVYGQLQAGATAARRRQPAWLRELNLDPRLRVAAAVGTRVVQERQEQLMARAWEQAGAVHDANALLRRSQLARELGTVVMERHLAPLRRPTCSR